MSNFNCRLKSLRKEFNISQMELAKQIGLSKSSINMYERGEREPGIETLKKFSTYFNVDIDYLLGKTDIKTKKVFSIAKRISSSISHNIRHQREQAGLTQQQLAKRLRIDEETINNLEEAKIPLETETLYKICDVLNIIPANILPTDEGELTENEEYLLWRIENQKRINETYNLHLFDGGESEPPLTEGEKTLLEAFRKLTPKNQEIALQMILGALEAMQ